MPGSATNDSTIAKGTYAYLLQRYGLATAYNTGTLTGTSAINGNSYNIALSPLFEVRAGGVYPYTTTTPFRFAGLEGDYWSARAYSSTAYAYSFYFDTPVYPSFNSYRYTGFSLRCLIPTP